MDESRASSKRPRIGSCQPDLRQYDTSLYVNRPGKFTASAGTRIWGVRDVRTHESAALPKNKTVPSMSYCFEQEGLLFRSYTTSHLREGGTFRYQLVVS